jgi:putative transcriptional regulator
MIYINLDAVLAQRKISSLELAQRIGITPANLSILKTGKAKAMRFSTLDAICRELECQPGDVLAYKDERYSGKEGPVPIQGRPEWEKFNKFLMDRGWVPPEKTESDPVGGKE